MVNLSQIKTLIQYLRLPAPHRGLPSMSMLCRVASRGERTGEESVDSSPVDWVGAFPSFFWLCVSMLMFIRLRSPFEVDLDEISEPCD